MLASAEDVINMAESILADKKYAEYYLLNYDEEIKRYKDAKKEFLYFKEEYDCNIGGGKSNKISNPTERIALKSIDFDKKYGAYKWLKAVEIVQRGLGERKNLFIQVRREAEKNNLYSVGRGRKGWVIFVQYRYSEEIEKKFLLPEVWVAENTLKSWWKEIINQTIFVANKI